MPIKKYSKVKFTLRKELIIILAVVLVMVLATILLLQPTKDQKFVSKWSGAGSSIVENKLYEEIDFDELDEVIAGEGITYVLFAHATDEQSVKAFDLVINLATGLDVEKVYIIDSEFAVGDREEDAELDAELKVIEEKYGITLDTPDLWAFENGSVVAELDQDLIEASSNDYTEAIKRVLLLNKKEA